MPAGVKTNGEAEEAQGGGCNVIVWEPEALSEGSNHILGITLLL